MPVQFVKCSKCGKIFPKSGDGDMCLSCSDEGGPQQYSEREALRVVRSYIRDALVGGELLTVQQVAEGTGVEGSKIWEFIHDGYIDLARFDDPDVRSYLVQKRLDQERAMRERRKSTEQAKSPPDLKKGKDRYHRKDKRGD